VIRAVFDVDQPGGIRTAISTLRMDCAAQTVAQVRVTSFSAVGWVLSDGDAQGELAELHAVPPTSPYRAVLDHVCARPDG